MLSTTTTTTERIQGLTKPGQNALMPPLAYIDFAVSVIMELFAAVYLFPVDGADDADDEVAAKDE